MPTTVWGVKDLHTSAQLVLAKRLGFFQQHGLEVECKLFSAEDKFLDAFERSPAKPLAWTQTLPQFLALRAAGLSAQIIAPLADISASYQVILRPNCGVILPGDLAGRRVGIMRGSLVEIALRNMAKDFDLDVADIKLLDAAPPQLLAWFANGEIDALACWEPWTTQAHYMGGLRYFSGLYSSIPGHEGAVNWLTAHSLFVTLEAHIRDRAETLLALLRSLEQATTYLNATMQRAAAVFSDLLGTEKDELAALLQKNRYTMQMHDLFYIGLVSGLNLLSPDMRAACSAEHPESLYVSHLLAQVNPAYAPTPSRDDRQPPFHEEILAQGNIFYPASARIHAPESRALRYIVVDDTQIVIEMFSEIVEMTGGEVVGTASTGAEAMVLYIDHLPDIVAMDISMPEMNGFEAIKHMLSINPQANIFVMSGNNYEEIRREAFRLGAKLFIGKPFHLIDILQVLQCIIQRAP